MNFTKNSSKSSDNIKMNDSVFFSFFYTYLEKMTYMKMVKKKNTKNFQNYTPILTASP